MFARLEGCNKMIRKNKDKKDDEDDYDFESPDASECIEQIHLKGPFSPLEMRVFGITNSSLGKNVKIEQSSVNTVLLDAEPQDPHTR